MILYKSIFLIKTGDEMLNTDLRKIIKDSLSVLGVNEGDTIQIESSKLNTIKKERAFVVNRLSRLVLSLLREETELPNMYKIGYAVRLYLEILSERKGGKFLKLKSEFFSGFNDIRHESVKYEVSQGAPLSDK